MTPERYCPKCKQNVPLMEGCPCRNCGYGFEVMVSKVELEELVGALEFQINDPDLARTEYRFAFETAAKFREKYLKEGKK